MGSVTDTLSRAVGEYWEAAKNVVIEPWKADGFQDFIGKVVFEIPFKTLLEITRITSGTAFKVSAIMGWRAARTVGKLALAVPIVPLPSPDGEPRMSTIASINNNVRQRLNAYVA